MCFCTPRVPSGKLTCFPGKGGPFKREVVISIIIFSGTMLNWLVVEPTHLKNMLVKLGSFFPNFRTENSKIFELPPPSKFRGCTSSRCFFLVGAHHPDLGTWLLICSSWNVLPIFPGQNAIRGSFPNLTTLDIHLITLIKALKNGFTWGYNPTIPCL